MSTQIRDFLDSSSFGTLAREPYAEPRKGDSPPAGTFGTLGQQETPPPPVVDAETPSSDNSKVLNNRYEPTRRVNIGCGDYVIRALDRNKLKFEDSNPFTTLIFIHEQFRAQRSALAPVLDTIRRWQGISHPHIVKTQDFIQLEPRSFLTTEHLQGCSLERRLADSIEAPLSVVERLRIINNVGSALNYVHAHDLVHGKLSPAAIWLPPSGPAKLIDPGVCSLLEAARLSETPDPRSYASSAYQSAESVANPHGVPDPRMDVYALACIGYELLTGQHPFDGLDAFEARTRKAQVRHLAPLNDQQWMAFKRALEFQASTRTATTQTFLNELNGSGYRGWLPAAVVAAALLALLFSGAKTFSGHSESTHLASHHAKRIAKHVRAKAAPLHEEPSAAADIAGVIRSPGDDQSAILEDAAPVESVVIQSDLASSPNNLAPSRPAGIAPQASARLTELIDRGNAQLAAGQFTTPPGSAAWDTFQEIIRLAPENTEAQPGIRKLSTHLMTEAQRALTVQDLDTAEIAVHRAQAIDPEAAGLVPLLRQLAELRQAGSLAQGLSTAEQPVE